MAGQSVQLLALVSCVALVTLYGHFTLAQPLAESLDHHHDHHEHHDPFALSNSKVFLQYFVSASGDDAKSGFTPAEAFATVDRALKEVRQLKNRTGQLPATVVFSFVPDSDGGQLFLLKDTVQITDEESGHGSTSVKFESQNSLKPITISGGQRINKWQKVDGLWQATLPETTKPFHQLFIGGQRRFLANTGVMQYEKVGGMEEHEVDLLFDGADYYEVYKKRPRASAKDTEPNYFYYKAGQIPDSLATEKNLEAVLYEIWTASVHQIEAIYPSNRTVYLKNPIAGRWMTSEATGHRYILQNSKQFLQPGSFFYDQQVHTLFYKPAEGDTPEMEAIVPQLTELVTILGSNGPVSNIYFIGLNFAHAMADFHDCFSGDCSAQSADFLTTAAIRMSNASNCVIAESSIAHVGGYAIWLDEACVNNTLADLHVYDLGAGAVRIGRGALGPPESDTKYNILSDSVLEDGGHIFKEGCGVLLQAAAYNTITHNLIHHFRYTGISMGWSWGYAPTRTYGNTVSYNHIHHIGLGELSDMGCVYSLGIQIGAQVVHNLCHDVWSYGYGGWAYYTDEGSSNMTYAYNIAYHTKASSLHQHYGENNEFLNNIFAYPHHIPCPDKTGGGCQACAIKSSRHPAGSGPGAFSSFNFERNIVYIANGTLFGSAQPTDFLFSNQTFDNNVYWNTITHEDVRFPPQNKPSTFSQWQARGKDTHSTVSDPLFTKASSFDFSQLAVDSPALKLGFRPIDTSTIGPRP